jgi:hypothetical protein
MKSSNMVTLKLTDTELLHLWALLDAPLKLQTDMLSDAYPKMSVTEGVLQGVWALITSQTPVEVSNLIYGGQANEE